MGIKGDTMLAPTFEVAMKNLKEGLVKCWYCENLVLVEDSRKVSVNQDDEDMCEDCFNSFSEGYDKS